MAKVWMVIAGEYGERQVCGVFSSLVNAEMFVAEFNYADSCELAGARVNETELDSGIDPISQGLHLWLVDMRQDGKTNQVYRAGFSDHHTENYRVCRNLPIQPMWLRARVWARDESDAVKIVNEHRVQLIASDQFVITPAQHRPTLGA